jgi:PKD repeat protein
MSLAMSKSALQFLRKVASTITVVIAVVAEAGCTSQTVVPPLTGTSSFAQTLTLTASPTTLTQDGTSQSTILLVATDASTRPIQGLTFVVQLAIGCGIGSDCSQGQIKDFGTLGQHTLVTDQDGRAQTSYTAPPAPPPLSGGSGTIVSVLATPKFDPGNTYQNFVRQQRVDIQLVPQGVIIPPAETPTPLFTFAPSAPSANSPVQFDATGSCPGGLATVNPPTCTNSGLVITAYNWDFGDGATAAGPVVKHSFALQQSYSVTLTVTNDRNRQQWKTQVVSVGPGSLPTAIFVFSPSDTIAPGQTVFFNGTGSRAGAGHYLVQYNWDFGDGGTATGALPTHIFQSAGQYSVTLVVVDEAGQSSATVSIGIKVTTPGSGGGNSSATASFTFSPASPKANTPVSFDATKSTPSSGATITSWSWTWGDISGQGSGVQAQHFYATPGPYTVVLTVIDSKGQSNSASQVITVVP